MLRERLLLQPDEAAHAFAIGRSTPYGLLATGALPSVRIGCTLRVPAASLREWIGTA